MMRFGPFLIFLCLYLCQCTGAPPRQVSKRTRGINFSYADDDLIIDELSSLCVDNQQKLFSNHVWEHVAEKHREKREQNTPGFAQERSISGLRGRLVHMAKNNNPELNRKLPEDLLNALRLDLNKTPQGSKPHYTAQEEKFIIEELSDPSCSSSFSSSALKTIVAKHDQKREAGTPGFSNKRTANSLRSYIDRLKRLGELPDEVVDKVRAYSKGSSSSYSTPSNQQETTEEEEDDE